MCAYSKKSSMNRLWKATPSPKNGCGFCPFVHELTAPCSVWKHTGSQFWHLPLGLEGSKVASLSHLHNKWPNKMVCFQMVISPQSGELLGRPMARWKGRDLYFVKIRVHTYLMLQKNALWISILWKAILRVYHIFALIFTENSIFNLAPRDRSRGITYMRNTFFKT